jgi:hypothetical protein
MVAHRGVGRRIGLNANLSDAQGETWNTYAFLQRMLDSNHYINED